MEDPWFELGRMGKDLTNEDTYFCKKAQAGGFKIYADCDTQMVHWTPVGLFPARTTEGWTVGLVVGDHCQVVLPHDILKQWAARIKEESKEQFTVAQVKGGK